MEPNESHSPQTCHSNDRFPNHPGYSSGRCKTELRMLTCAPGHARGVSHFSSLTTPSPAELVSTPALIQPAHPRALPAACTQRPRPAHAVCCAQDAHSSKRDARTVPVFLHIDRVVKCFAVAVSELFGSKPFVYLPALLLADLSLLTLNALFSPCCVPTINTIKNIAYAYASWTVIVSFASATLTVCPHSLYPPRTSHQSGAVIPGYHNPAPGVRLEAQSPNSIPNNSEC